MNKDNFRKRKEAFQQKDKRQEVTFMSHCLEDLKQGASDFDDGPEESIPKDFDRKKFDRGRRFFMNHAVSCLLAMLFSLVCGLSVSNLLDVLVATGKTSKPRDSIRRYLRTTFHVIKWHYGNILNESTSAGKSIRAVRQIHNNAREFMVEKTKKKGDNTNRVWISQYDMSLVQCGFMGAIIMYPRDFGIRCSKQDLDDYVYFWRFVGFCLGIKDRNNICYGGYDQAFKLCKDIECSVLLPAMRDPPEFFFPMANAFSEGNRQLFKLGLWSMESILTLTFDHMGEPRPKYINLSFIDRLRMLLWHCLVNTLYYTPGLLWLLSKLMALRWSNIT